MFVETNLITTNLLGCHNNSSIISGKDAGEAVEEYAAHYMTKEGAPLRQAAAILLASLEEIRIHPSSALDSGTAERTGKHVATRTVNAFTGSHQWSLPLMAFALLGHSSHLTSEIFSYVFSHAAVIYKDSLRSNGYNCKQSRSQKMVATMSMTSSTISYTQWMVIFPAVM